MLNYAKYGLCFGEEETSCFGEVETSCTRNSIHGQYRNDNYSNTLISDFIRNFRVVMRLGSPRVRYIQFGLLCQECAEVGKSRD